MILTNEEIMQINQTAEFDSALGYARKIEQAVLESYKAELLKEVGEPVLYAEFAEDGGWLGDASEYQYLLKEPHALYTSDQLRQGVQELEKERDDLIAKNQNLFNALMVSTQKKDNMYASIKAASGHLNLYGLFSCVGGDSYDPECADENVRKANSILRSELATEIIKPAGKEDQVVYDLYCEELLQITGNEKFRLKLVDDPRKNRVILCNRCGRDAE